MTDHQWPAELTPDAECENCSLVYKDWAPEAGGCPGVKVPKPTWEINSHIFNVVIAHYDAGSEWEESVVFGPFDTLEDAEHFLVEHERIGNMNPDGTVQCELSDLHRVRREGTSVPS